MAQISLGESVGLPVGEPVGLEVGHPVGLPVGVPVGFPVGEPVGLPVGEPVGDDVGLVVGENVLSSVLKQTFASASHGIPVFGAVAFAVTSTLYLNSSPQKSTID